MGSKSSQTHRNLDVWREGLQLAQLVYEASSTFPKEERFGMVSQLRRAAVSIVSNIAEGAARGSTREYLQFLCIARGSLAELDTQLLLAERLQLTSRNEAVWRQLELTGRLLTALHRAIRSKASHAGRDF